MKQVNLEGLKELADKTEFQEIRELCLGLIEKFKEFQRENEGSFDLEDFRQKIGELKNYVFRCKYYSG